MNPVEKYTPDELEALYNNRAAVPEHGEIFADWEKRSAEQRAALRCQLDLPYGDRPRQTLDFFPAEQRQAPLQVFIHGGYWRSLGKNYFSFLAEPFVTHGIAFAAINYPLCPAATMDEIVASVRTALAWIWHHTSDFSCHPDQVHVSGHSAGGHLVAMALATDWSALDASVPRALIKSAVAISGVYELEPLLHVSMNQDLHLDGSGARRNSPAQLEPATRVPLVVAYGERETAEFCRQSIDFAENWRGRGQPVELLGLPGLNHFNVLTTLADPASPLFQATRRVMGMTTG